MPVIPKPQSDITINSDLRLIGFDRAKTGKDNHYNRAVHFFLYDYKFEDIWNNPQKYIETLKKYKAVLTPDFSMYIEMNPVMQLYNTFRNRWVVAYMASKGINVIPTVNWGLENTFDFCFNGIEKGSIVAVSTYMYHEHGNHSDQKELFMKGYNEMLKRIEPELIICCHEPFPEMQGNILYINYDLSSWQHYEDDECKSFYPPERIFKYHSGRVMFEHEEKGGGSAYGGKWKPKKEADERFIGNPGEVKEYWMPTKKGGYLIKTKIGEDGYAEIERHFSDHGKPSAHSIPHDHIIDWSKGFPYAEKPVNYQQENIPELKFVEKDDKQMTHYKNTNDFQFENISDFKWCLIYGGEVEFVWNKKIYSITRDSEGKWGIMQIYKDETNQLFNNIDELLVYKLESGEILKDIITKAEISSRTL